VFYGLARVAFIAAGVDVTSISAPERTGSAVEIFGSVIFAPIAETLLLAFLLWALQKATRNRWFICVISAIAWGSLHASFGALWFFGTAWSFFVFSASYLWWRNRSFVSAFAAAVVPHSLINTSVFIVLALSENAV